MWNNFFKHIDIRAENAHILDGNAEDLDAECRKYEEEISKAGGIDLFIGGLSLCCHKIIGPLLACSAVETEKRIVSGGFIAYFCLNECHLQNPR